MRVSKRKGKGKQNQSPPNKKSKEIEVEDEEEKVKVKEDEEKVKVEEQVPNHSIFPDIDDTLVVAKSVGDVPPAHYTFKVKSYSLLSRFLQKTGLEKYESSDFEAGGYKWKLLLYPNGNKKKDVNDHISLYLAMSDTNNLPLGWEVNMIFKFFVFDHIRDKYLTIEAGRVVRFHAWKTERGIPRFLSLSSFNNPANGYLVDDCCVFGAEVFVIKREGKGLGESLSMINEPENGTFTWKLENFSGLKEKSYASKEFTVGGCQWNLELYPTGYSSAKGHNLSLFLRLINYSELRPGWKLYVEFKLSIKDQVHGKHFERTASYWYRPSYSSWGFINFRSLSDIKDEKEGFILNDSLIAEGKINFISLVNCFA